MASKHGNGPMTEKPTAHQAGRPYNCSIIIKHDNKETRQQKVKVKRLIPTWTGHKFSSNSNE